MMTLDIEPQADQQEIAARTRSHSILQSCVCLRLSCHYLGNNRKVDVNELVEMATGDETVNVDEDAFSATRKLLPNRALLPVMRRLGHAKYLVRMRSFPSGHIFGESTFLVPKAGLVQLHRDLKAENEAIRAEAVALSERYADLVAAQAARQGKMFRLADYRTKEQVAESFYVTWNYVSFAAPDGLLEVDAALAMEAGEKHEARLAAVYDEASRLVRADALRVVRELADRLRPREDGRNRTVRDSALRDLQDYVAALPAKSGAVQDAELPAAMARLQALAAGRTPQNLRDNRALAASIAAVAEETAGTLEQLVQTHRGRAMSFEPL